MNAKNFQWVDTCSLVNCFSQSRHTAPAVFAVLFLCYLFSPYFYSRSQASEQDMLIGCWERVNRSEEMKAHEYKSLPYASLCFSPDSGLRGFFMGSNGLGSDMASSWRMINPETLQVDRQFCEYVAGSSHMQLLGCSDYAGNWMKRCSSARMTTDRDNCSNN
jgi:hypothetical protein